MPELDLLALNQDFQSHAKIWCDAFLAELFSEAVSEAAWLSQLESVGESALQLFWRKNRAIAEPLRQLLSDVDRGGQVNQQLKQLNDLIQRMKPPAKVGFWRRWFNQLFQSDSGASHWAESFKQNRQQLQQLIKRLSASEQLLKRDRQILTSDHRALLEAASPLQHFSPLLKLLKTGFDESVASSSDQGVRWQAFSEDSLNPLVQSKRLEWQQQTTIAQQAVLTLEMVLEQNQAMLDQISHAIHMGTSILDVTTNAHWVNERGDQVVTLGDQVSENWQQWLVLQRQHQRTLEEASTHASEKTTPQANDV